MPHFTYFGRFGNQLESFFWSVILCLEAPIFRALDQSAPPLLLIALLTVGWLLYNLYLKNLLQQGKPGKIKLALIALGVVFLFMTATGRAPALSVEELAALRDQIARQQLRLEEQEVTLSEQQTLIELKDKQLAEQEENIKWLQERLNLLLAKRYSHNSEKDNDLQLSLLDKEELDAAIAEAEQQLNEAQVAMDKADQQAASADQAGDGTPSDEKPDGKPREDKGGSSAGRNPPKRKKKLPDSLRRITLDVDLSDEQKQAMGDQWIQIGWETSEQLAVQEREYYVKQIRRAKYIRLCADEQGQNTQGIQVAPALPVILLRAIADSSLLAKICTGKFVDALSFNRECKVMAREGIEIGYSTLCSYPIQLTQRLEPLQALFERYPFATTEEERRQLLPMFIKID